MQYWSLDCEDNKAQRVNPVDMEKGHFRQQLVYVSEITYVEEIILLFS